MIRTRSIFLAISLLIITGPVAAQGPGGTAAPAGMNPLAFMDQAMEDGQWREYRMVGGEVDGTVFKWVWLGTEERDGTRYRWVEMYATLAGDESAVKMLFDPQAHGDPPLEFIVKVGDQPAMQIPMNMMGGNSFASPETASAAPTVTGTETVTVPAGEFETTVYESEISGKAIKTYVSQSLPGMVLAVGPNARMELTGAGDGAKARITEKPLTIQQMIQ